MDVQGNELLVKKLLDAGNNLLTPSSVVTELLASLDLVESLLAEVDQSPPESTREALIPIANALIAEELLKHSNADVKVAVASCISEITRITAPEASYEDVGMKEMFQLFVSSFENLDDISSPSYIRRISILETLAKVRSCVVMLDLECHDLIAEMFRHFFKTIRDDHVDGVFSSMETIMTLVLEESEEISIDLLSSILKILRKDNEDVLPIACQLAENVITQCSSVIKPYLLPALKSSGTSLGDYRKAVADIFLAGDQVVKATVSDAANNILADGSDIVNEPSKQTVEVAMETMEDAPPSKVAGVSTVGSSKTAISNGILKKGDEDIPVLKDNFREASNDGQEEEVEPSKTRLDSVADVESPKSKTKPQKSARRKGRKQNVTKSSLEPFGPVFLNRQVDVLDMVDYQEKVGEDIDIQSEDVDALKAARNEHPSDAHVDETRSKNIGRGKKKEHPVQEESISGFDSRKESDTKKDSKRASEKSSSVSDKEEIIPGFADETKKKDDKIIELYDISAKDLGQEVEVEGGQRVNNKKQGQTEEEDDEKIKLDGTTTKDLVQETAVEGTQHVYKKKKGQTKVTPAKRNTKAVAKDDKNKTLALVTYTPKATKDGSGIEEASKSNSKRKRPSEGKALQTMTVAGPALVGARVEVWWPKDVQFYKGVVKAYSNSTKEHVVYYDDGDAESLNLKNELWRIVEDSGEHATAGGSLDEPIDETPIMAITKKAKTSVDHGAQPQKTTSSTKTPGPASGKSKTKPKSKSVSKPKSKGEASKKVGKSNPNTSGKAKSGTPIIDLDMEDESLVSDTTLGKSKDKSESAPHTQKSSTKRKPIPKVPFDP